MGERRVSESPPEARLRSLRPSEKAGAIAAAPGPHRGLHSKAAIAGAAIAASATTRVHPGIIGRADHPPQPAQPASDFVTTNRRLRGLHSGLPVSKAKLIHYRALQRLSKFVLDRFDAFGDDLKKLPRYDGRTTRAERAYTNLQDKARRAEIDGDSARASAIRGVLAEIDRHAAENLQTLTETHAQAGPSSARQPQQAPATTVPTIDWRTAYRQCLDIRRYFEHANQQDDAQQFLAAMRHMEDHVRRRFATHGGKREDLFPIGIGHLTRPEQMCRFLEDMARRTKPASGTEKPSGIHRTIQTLNENARKELSSLTRTYGSLEDLAARTGLTQQQAPATVSSTPTSATAQATVAPPLQPVDPVPVPAREVPLAQRKAIVERFRSEEALLDVGSTPESSCADALGSDATRTQRVSEPPLDARLRRLPLSEQAPDFVTTNEKLRSLCSQQPASQAKADLLRAVWRLSHAVLAEFEDLGGQNRNLAPHDRQTTKAERMYRCLQEAARQAENDGDSARASEIREALIKVDRRAADDLRELSETHGLAGPSSTQAPRRTPATTVPQWDWRTTHRHLLSIKQYLDQADRPAEDAQRFLAAIRRMENHVRQRFRTHGGKEEDLFSPRSGTIPRPEQMCRVLEDIAHRQQPASGATKPPRIHRAMETLYENARIELRSLTSKYGPLEDLAAEAAAAEQQVPMTDGSTATAATGQVTVAPLPQPVDSVPVPGSVPVDTSLPPAGEAGQTQWVSATPSPVAAISSTPLRTAPWLEDHYAVERALIAGQLPPGFDASQLITEARACEQFGLATALAAGRLPMPDIEALIEEGEAADKGGSHALSIHYLRTLKKDIQNALHAAYPERVGREWLDRVRQLLLRHEALAAAIASPPLSPFASRRPESGTVEIPSIADLYSEPGGSE